MSTKKIKARKMWLNLASDGVVVETLKWDKRSKRVYVIDGSDIPKLVSQIDRVLCDREGDCAYGGYADTARAILADFGIKEKGKR